ncbi:hypothetical protein [Streptomyces sp. NPDC051219]|uniref:hypothetical protein n=1 Tax=Streptomyces sp. NPDC051219 TaxID=3155283 RepID=UPI00342B2124
MTYTTGRLAALALGAALLLAGCSGPNGGGPGEDAPGERDGSEARPRPALAQADDSAPRTGPAKARIGTWYPYDLFSHCGISTMKFSGQWWRLTTLRTDLDSQVAGDPVDWGENYTPGYIQLESAKVAVFEAAGHPPLMFAPGAEPTTPCK